MPEDSGHTGIASDGSATSAKRDVRIPILAAAVAVIIILMVFLMGSPPGYVVGDDYGQDLYARGEMYDTPGLLMPYTLFPVSAPLCLLYRALPSVPWYPLLLLGLIATATAIMLNMVLRLTCPTMVRALFIAIVLSGEISLALCLTYSIVAFAACAAGLVLILAHVGFTRQTDMRVSDGLAYLLIAVGYSLRPESGLGAAALFTPFLAWAIVRNRNARTMLMAAGVVICMIACSTVGTIAYRTTEGWEDYDQMLAVTRSVVDYPHLSHAESSAVAPQLSSNDLEVMYRFLFVDRNVYDNETLRALSGIVQRYGLTWFENLGSSVGHAAFLCALVAALVLLALFVCWSFSLHGPQKTLALSIPAAFLLLVSYLILRSRTNIQAILPLFTLGLYALILCASAFDGAPGHAARPRRREGILATVGIVACAIIAALFASNASLPNGKHAAKMEAYLDEHPDDMLVILNSFGEMVGDYDILTFDARNNPTNVAMIGSYDHLAAPWKAFLLANDLDGGAFLLQMLDNERMVGVAPPSTAQHVRTYLAEHAHTIVIAERVGDLAVDGQGSRLWHFRSARPSVNETAARKLSKRLGTWFTSRAQGGRAKELQTPPASR